jgi:transcriptional regulator
VAFEIEITRIESKFKLSQNKSDADRQRVMEQLLASGDSESERVADLMART